MAGGEDLVRIERCGGKAGLSELPEGRAAHPPHDPLNEMLNTLPLRRFSECFVAR